MIRCAEVAQVCADLDLLADAHHQPREVERLDRHVLLHLLACVPKRHARRHRLLAHPVQCGGDRLVFRRVETHALKIGEHHHLAHRLVHRLERTGCEVQRLRHACRAVACGCFPEHLREPREVVSRRIQQAAAALAHQHHVHFALALHRGDHLLHVVLRHCEIHGARAARLHRVAVVEQHDGARPRVAEQAARALPNRTRHCQREQHGDCAPDGEQYPLFHAHAALIRPQHHLQKVHRAPLHDLEAALVEKVNDDRDRQRRGACNHRCV